jgi:hypothetical protein
MKILNVHPILMYLNSSSEDHRRSVTSRYQDLTSASKSEIDAEVNHGNGIKDVWIEILQFIHSSNLKTYKLSELIY